MDDNNTNIFRNLPSVDKILKTPEIKQLFDLYDKESILFAIRHSLDFFREKIKNTNKAPSETELYNKIKEFLSILVKRNLKKVYNATGIIINTNIGRAPLGDELLKESFEKISGYNNLEFDLKTGERGNRNQHTSQILKFLTGAEDVLVVNNAAAAVLLCLNTFAKNKEVIVSRGELVEIGGSFRIPDIMAASGCKMKEIGTTNKTKPADYKNAINEKTALIFKAHKSNYIIKGFTQEVELEELCQIGKENGIPVMYDQGSGLLKKSNHSVFDDEPDIKTSVSTGIDIICFSGDKLLGGPQAGIIAGKKVFIDKLKKNPLHRALRVCKTTIAMLETACSYYLKDETLYKKNMVFRLLSQSLSEIENKAVKLLNLLKKEGIETVIIDNSPLIGGGSLPDKYLDSKAVLLKVSESSNKIRSSYAEKMYYGLLETKTPVLGILKKGNIIFDMLTIDENSIENVASIIADVHQKIKNTI